MLVYRYENKDGGSPWFYKNGSIRCPLPDPALYLNSEKYVYGCDSLKSLFEYFSTQDVDVNNCIIKTYDIPDKDIIFLNKQVKFPKRYLE